MLLTLKRPRLSNYTANHAHGAENHAREDCLGVKELRGRRSNNDHHVNEEAHNHAQACIRELGIRPGIQSSPLRLARGISLL